MFCKRINLIFCINIKVKPISYVAEVAIEMKAKLEKRALELENVQTNRQIEQTRVETNVVEAEKVVESRETENNNNVNNVVAVITTNTTTAIDDAEYTDKQEENMVIDNMTIETLHMATNTAEEQQIEQQEVQTNKEATSTAHLGNNGSKLMKSRRGSLTPSDFMPIIRTRKYHRDSLSLLFNPVLVKKSCIHRKSPEVSLPPIQSSPSHSPSYPPPSTSTTSIHSVVKFQFTKTDENR